MMPGTLGTFVQLLPEISVMYLLTLFKLLRLLTDDSYPPTCSINLFLSYIPKRSINSYDNMV